MNPRHRSTRSALLLLVCATLVSGLFVTPSGDALTSVEPPQGKRDRLTVRELVLGGFAQPVHNDYFMPVGQALPAAHSLSGVMHFEETLLNTERPDSDFGGSGQRYFPEFAVAMVAHGDELLPLERRIIYSGNIRTSFWNIILSPGRVWREEADGGYSRGSFPFVLTDNSIGQALNGLATFIFTSTSISHVAIQVTQETSPNRDYTRADMAGAVAARFTPREFEDAALHIAARERELAARPPVRDWNALPAGRSTRPYFNAGLPPEEVSVAALLVGGALYLHSAATRTGPYPYPLEMRHGVFSVTKTLAMGLSMFYLAERYGEHVFSELITDYVPELADHPGWRGVTFENALDMATGTAGNDRDINFIRARSAAEKIAVVHSMPDAAPAPGEVFDYSSSNTFTLSYAVSRYVKAREGIETDYWDLVVENVLEHLGIEFMPVVRTREPDGSRGVLITCWGSYPTVVEAAVVAELMSNEGLHEGRILLNGHKLREAMERTGRLGLLAGRMSGRPSRYIHSFWIAEVPLLNEIIKAPHMSGFGGSFVVVLPGGTVALRFADEGIYEIAPMVAVAELCGRSLH